jgi:D-alanine-D-alanine ligase
MQRTRIGVIFGGQSGEHEVSLVSARAVVAGLDPPR